MLSSSLDINVTCFVKINTRASCTTVERIQLDQLELRLNRDLYLLSKELERMIFERTDMNDESKQFIPKEFRIN